MVNNIYLFSPISRTLLKIPIYKLKNEITL